MTVKELNELLFAARVLRVETMEEGVSEEIGWEGGRPAVGYLICRYGKKRFTLVPCRDEEQNGPGALEVGVEGADGDYNYDTVGIAR